MKAVLIVVAYVLISILSFAYVWQRIPIDAGSRTPTADRYFGSSAAGLFWPIYWVGKLAMSVTAPPPPARAESES